MSQSQSHSGIPLATAPNGPTGFRFSTGDLPPHFRVSRLNGALARGILGSQVSEVGDRPLDVFMVEFSYFIRVFVQRFGMSPGDMRAGSGGVA